MVTFLASLTRLLFGLKRISFSLTGLLPLLERSSVVAPDKPSQRRTQLVELLVGQPIQIFHIFISL